MNYNIPSGALRVLRTLTDAGYQAHLVGGCVRDLLRGVRPHDWDICTSARPEQTKACFSAGQTADTGVRHGTVTVFEEDGAYEVTTWRVDGGYSDGRHPDQVRFTASLREDLARRDFTMNAIAMDRRGELTDPFGGGSDIEKGLIRCVGVPEDRFHEDGRRVMRALRFASQLGYEIEPGTGEALRRCRTMLTVIPAECVQDELRSVLTGPGVGRMLREYPDLFCAFWPELEPLTQMEQHSPWHLFGGWEHTVRAVESVRPDVALRLAMLLHDVGKPGCKSTDESGADHFYGHAAAGAELADNMLRALRFDNDTVERVVTLVKYHGAAVPTDEKGIRRMLNKLGTENFFLLLEVIRADNMAKKPEMVRDRLDVLEEVRAMAEEIVAQGQCFSLKDLAVGGRDIMACGVEPGPKVGELLSFALDQVLDGALPNQREALLRAVRERLGE